MAYEFDFSLAGKASTQRAGSLDSAIASVQRLDMDGAAFSGIRDPNGDIVVPSSELLELTSR